MSALSLVSGQRPSNNKNPILQRRNKFAASIDSQIVKLGHFMEGKRVRRESFWIDASGTWFFQMKYGKHNVEPKKGMSVLKATNGEDLIAQLDEVKAVTIAGGLDDALTACASAVRANFKTAKDKKAAGR